MMCIVSAFGAPVTEPQLRPSGVLIQPITAASVSPRKAGPPESPVQAPAELPLPAVNEGFDEIERQVGVEQRRQHGPDRKMERQEAAERGLRPVFDKADQSGQ